MLRLALFVFCCGVVSSALYEGDKCNRGGVSGTCQMFNKCNSAIKEVKSGGRPQICGFAGDSTIVCCLDGPLPSTTTTEVVLQDYDDDDYPEDRSGDQCEPIEKSLTAPKTGQKAWDKCVEYQEKYVYPCEQSVTFVGGATRFYRCHHNADELIAGGVEAALHEFPHMAMIGLGKKPNLSWVCGGSIISENFILSAGHCIADRLGNVASHVAIGLHSRSELATADDSKIYKIKRIVKHPQYKSPKKYNDIVLMEIETPMKLTHYTAPACLDIGNSPNDDMVSATGWGLMQHRGRNLSETLQKVILSKFTNQECIDKFPPTHNMPRGLDPAKQICYGDKDEPKDTCGGDSGGPVQIKSKKLNCMYVIVGVTSLGKACGFTGDPGLYTRVSPYIPWIESVVWP